MLVFKTFFRLLIKMRGTIILYFAIFLTVALIMSKEQTKESSRDFHADELDIAIIDRDEGSFGSIVETYFKDSNHLVEIEDDTEAITEELYWRKVDYVLIIPKGFEESISNGKPSMELSCMEVPGNFDSSFFKAELDMFMDKLFGLTAGGMSLEEAAKKMDGLKDEQVKVEMASYVNANQSDYISNFFSFAPYLFLTICVVAVGTVLILMNSKEVRNRMECSSTPLMKRQISLFAGIVVYGLFVLAVVIGIAAILSKGSLFTDVRLPFFVLNMLTMLIFGLSLGYLAGNVCKTSESIKGVLNTSSLALCFLGGVFIPQEFFGEKVLQAAKFVPTYWYIRSNSEISRMSTVTSPFLKEILLQNLVVIGYAVALFAITITIVSIGRNKTEA